METKVRKTVLEKKKEIMDSMKIGEWVSQNSRIIKFANSMPLSALIKDGYIIVAELPLPEKIEGDPKTLPTIPSRTLVPLKQGVEPYWHFVYFMKVRELGDMLFKKEQMRYALSQILKALPENSGDWLDPEIKAIAKEALKKPEKNDEGN